MRGLVVVTGTLGLLVGLGSAALVHVLPLGEISFFAYTPALGPGGFIPETSFELNWLPSLWALPLVGLVLGLLAALVVHRLGWRLARSAVGQQPAVSGPAGHGSPYPGYPVALQTEVDALSAEGNALLEAAAGLTAEQLDARLEQLVAESRALWSRAGWTELEQQVSALGMRTSLALLAGVLRDEDRGHDR